MLGSTSRIQGSSTSSPGHCRSDPEGIWYSSCYTRADTSTRHQLNDSAWLDCRRLSLWLVWSPLWWVRWWLLWTISRGAVYWEVSHLKSEHAAPFQSDESVEQPPVEQPVNSKSPWGLEGSCQNSSQQKKKCHLNGTTIPYYQTYYTMTDEVKILAYHHMMPDQSEIHPQFKQQRSIWPWHHCMAQQQAAIRTLLGWCLKYPATAGSIGKTTRAVSLYFWALRNPVGMSRYLCYLYI